MNSAAVKGAPRFYGDNFEPHYRQNILSAFRELLTTKHLYQSVTVDDGFIAGVAKVKLAHHRRQMAMSISPGSRGVGPDEQVYEAEGRKLVAVRWDVKAAPAAPLLGIIKQPKVPDSEFFEVVLPHIQTRCAVCETRWPFNPVEVGIQYGRKNVDQWWCIAYECQNCKTEPVRFLVRRSGLKLTLCGRDPIEGVERPSYLPKAVTKHYSGALHAHQSGQTLPGIFLLRVCIEQYWRSLPQVMEKMKGIAKPTGDELGAAYKAGLPNDFKERFPTLAETYEQLSNAMHTANADAAVFTQACENIDRHFDAKRIYRIVDAAPVSPTPEPAGRLTPE